jgi:hypothetical protein
MITAATAGVQGGGARRLDYDLLGYARLGSGTDFDNDAQALPGSWMRLSAG